MKKAKNLPSKEKEECLESIKNSKYICYDFETTSLSPRTGEIDGVAVSTDDGDWWFPKDTGKDVLHTCAMREDVYLIAHNQAFDYKWLKYKWEIEPECQLVDTMIAMWLLDENYKRYSLDHAVKRFFDHDMISYEEVTALEGTLFEGSTDSPSLGEYAKEDSRYCLKLFYALFEPLKEQGLLKVFFELEMPVCKFIADMEYNGIKISAKNLGDFRLRTRKELEDTANEIYELCGKKFLLTSPQQVSQVLFDSKKEGGLELPTEGITEKGKSGYYSTSKEVLERLVDKVSNKVPKLLLKHRELSKAIDSFSEPFVQLLRESTDQRVHPSFHQIRTVTGRLSASDPNLQQMPTKGGFRDVFVPEEGNIFIGADFCLAEGTLVHTSNRGFVPIENIIPGVDIVPDDSGKDNEVTSVFVRGEKEVYKVTTDLGYSIYCTKNHKFRVIDDGGNYVWKALKDISDSDYIAIQPGRGESSYAHEFIEPSENYHYRIKNIRTPKSVFSTNLCELLGYWSGDGCFYHKQVTWVINSRDVDLADKVASYVERFFGVDLSGSYLEYRGVRDYRFLSVKLADWVRKNDVSKDHAPEWLFKSGNRDIAAWLRGYFEADGSVQVNPDNGGRVSIASSRPQIMRDVQLLLLRLGIVSCYREQVVTCSGKKHLAYVVDVKAGYTDVFKDKIGFLSGRKRGKLESLVNSTKKPSPMYGNYPNLNKVANKYPHISCLRNVRNRGDGVSLKVALELREDNVDVFNEMGLYRITDWGQVYVKIKDVYSVGVLPTYDLEVPNGNTFVANGFVSHNSQVELRVLAHLSEEPRMLEAFRNGDDIHDKTRELMGLPSGTQGRKIAKCVVGDTLFFSKNGVRRIDEFKEDFTYADQFISASDCIWNGNEYVSMTNVYYNGKAKIHNIITRRGVLRAAENHQILTSSGDLKRSEDVVEGDILSLADIPTYDYSPSLSVNPFAICSRSDYSNDTKLFRVNLDSKFAYFAGIFVGDGYFCGKRHVSVAVGKDYPDWRAEIIRSIEEVGFNYNRVVSSSENCDSIYFGSAVVCRFLRMLGIADESGKKLRIPKWVFANKNNMWNFLAGLIDTDGTVSKDTTASITTKSLDLASDLCILLRSLVGDAYLMEPCWNSKYEKYYWRVHILRAGMDKLLDTNVLRCSWKKSNLKARCSKKRRRNKNKPNEVILKFVSEEEDVYDVSVDTDDHLYVANNFITHNTINFGIVYGMGSSALSQTASISKRKAKKFIDKFFSQYKGIKVYQDKLKRQLFRGEPLRTITGRYRRVPFKGRLSGYEAERAFRQYFNSIIQGSAADIMGLAMKYLGEWFKSEDNQVKCLAQIHDELLFSIPEISHVYKSFQKIIEIMESSFNLKVPLIADGYIGYKWVKKMVCPKCRGKFINNEGEEDTKELDLYEDIDIVPEPETGIRQVISECCGAVICRE